MGRLVSLIVIIALLTLPACSSEDLYAPAVSIISPAVGSPVTGTTTVQMSATDDIGIRDVKLYVRGKGGTARGVLAGSASQSPYVVSWYTLGQPNFSDLELIAVAGDFSGRSSESSPVAVKIQNSGVPGMAYFLCYSFAGSGFYVYWQAGLSTDGSEPGLPVNIESNADLLDFDPDAV